MHKNRMTYVFPNESQGLLWEMLLGGQLEIVACWGNPSHLDHVLCQYLVVDLGDVSLFLGSLPLGQIGSLEHIHEGMLIDGYLVHFPR